MLVFSPCNRITCSPYFCTAADWTDRRGYTIDITKKMPHAAGSLLIRLFLNILRYGNDRSHTVLSFLPPCSLIFDKGKKDKGTDAASTQSYITPSKEIINKGLPDCIKCVLVTFLSIETRRVLYPSGILDKHNDMSGYYASLL